VCPRRALPNRLRHLRCRQRHRERHLRPSKSRNRQDPAGNKEADKAVNSNAAASSRP
jgi:hypothetical protein